MPAVCPPLPPSPMAATTQNHGWQPTATTACCEFWHNKIKTPHQQVNEDHVMWQLQSSIIWWWWNMTVSGPRWHMSLFGPYGMFFYINLLPLLTYDFPSLLGSYTTSPTSAQWHETHGWWQQVTTLPCNNDGQCYNSNNRQQQCDMTTLNTTMTMTMWQWWQYSKDNNAKMVTDDGTTTTTPQCC